MPSGGCFDMPGMAHTQRAKSPKRIWRWGARGEALGSGRQMAMGGEWEAEKP